MPPTVRTYTHLRAVLVLTAGLVLAGCQTTPDAPEPNRDYGALVGKAFGSGGGQLLVLLHGDLSRGGPAEYHYGWAQEFSLVHPDATVIALVRPGYENAAGERSGGNNHDRRDQYTPTNNALVAEAIRTARFMHPAGTVVAAGHSGGAAQLGTVIGKNPGLVDEAILLACPCNIDRWRTMNGRTGVWRRSESPHRVVDRIGDQTRVTLVVGSEDENTWSALSEEYAAAATAAGVTAQVMLAPGGDHHGNGALVGSFKAAVAQAFSR